MNKRNRNLWSVLFMAMAMLCSCGSSVDGYKFSGDGILGSIPEARAKSTALFLEECGNLEKSLEKARSKDNPHALNLSSDEFVAEVTKVRDRIHDKLGDDLREAMLSDIQRLESGKDFPLENKTQCPVRVTQVVAHVDTALAEGGKVRVCLSMDESKAQSSEPQGIYYLAKSADGKMLDKGSFTRSYSEKDYDFYLDIYCNDLYTIEEMKADKSKYDEQMHYLMSLDSIASIELVDYATYFDYTTERATTEGVGPVKIGAKIDDVPDSCSLYVYKEMVNVMQPDMTVCEFQDMQHDALFTAIGDGQGKIKSIDVERLPIKVGGKVVSTHVFVRDAVENLKDVAEWSFDNESQNVVASFEGGKVTISLGSNVFNESGFAKYQQLQKGVKGIKFDYNDFNDYDMFEEYTIKGK